MNRYLFVIFCFILINFASGKEFKKSAKVDFLSDTLAIGKPVEIAFIVTYSPEQVLLFPDSAKDFNPFELRSRRIFETRLENGMAIDSVIYSIVSFEINKIQYFYLPYYIISSGDTLTYYSNTDSIKLMERIPVMNDSLQTKYFKELLPLDNPPDYLLYFIYFALFGIVISIIYIKGKKPFLIWLKKRALKKEWERIVLELEGLSETNFEARPYFTKLSSIMLSYLNSSYNLLFSSLTAKELERELSLYSELTSQDLNTFSELRNLEETISYSGKPIEEIDRQKILSQTRSSLENLFNSRLNKIS